MAAMKLRRAALLLAATGVAVTLGVCDAEAAQTLRVGKAVVQVFAYVPLDIGLKYGFFRKAGLDVQETNFAGGAKLAQALTAGAVDIALSGGPEMAFTAKGAPEIAVATIADSPAFMGINVGTASTAKTINDLKGKKIAVTSAGSVTYWLVQELNRVKGWKGAEQVVPVALGGRPSTQLSAIRAGEVDGALGGVSVGYQLEERHTGRLLAPVSAYIKHLELFVAFASDAVIKQQPDAVRRFLKAWFQSVAYMRTHRAETVALTSQVIPGYSTAVSAQLYDTLMSKISTDGKFRKNALDPLAASFVQLKVLPPPVDMSKLYTQSFLPKS